MAGIDDYVLDPRRALVDAAADPVFRAVLDPEDYEMVAVDQGDGTQRRVQAVKAGAVGKAVKRIIDVAQSRGVDIKLWICAREQFDLCRKLDTPIGTLMRQLNAFLNKAMTEGVVQTLGLLGTFAAIGSAVILGKFLAIFSAVGFINKVFVNLCDCPTN